MNIELIRQAMLQKKASNEQPNNVQASGSAKEANAETPAAVAPKVPGSRAFGSAKEWLKTRRAGATVAAPKAVATQPDNNQVKSAAADLPLAHRILLDFAYNGMPKSATAEK